MLLYSILQFLNTHSNGPKENVLPTSSTHSRKINLDFCKRKTTAHAKEYGMKSGCLEKFTSV